LLKKNKRICVVDTVYTLFLYYLICGIDENDIIIMSTGIPESIRKNINHIYFPPFKYKEYSDSSKIKKIKQRLINISQRVYYMLKTRLILLVKVNKKEVEVYGHAHLIFSFPLYEYDKAYLIEDGLGNYLDLKEPNYTNSIYSKMIRFIGADVKNIYECYGTHKNIKKVYLTKNKFPEIIKDKVKVVNIKELWNEKTENEKSKILKIFNINRNKIKFNKETVLILTQPLSEEKLTTLDEELTIYKNIIEKFKDYDIIIKPHPREEKDYKNIFPNVKIINKSFPIELLSLIGVEPDIAGSIVSTALFNFKKSKIYVYDGELKDERLINGRDELIKLLKEENIELIT